MLNATINADNFNVTAGKDFYYDGVDFKLDANDSLVVLGSAFFNVDDFYNYGMLPQEITFSIVMRQQSIRITSMLPQEITFSIVMGQQSIRITSMLPQEITFSIVMGQQSIRITSMLQQEVTFSIRITQLLVQITSMLQRTTFIIMIMQRLVRIT